MDFRDNYQLDTTEAVKSLDKLGDTQAKVEKSSGGFKSKFAELAGGFAEAAGESERFSLGLNDLGDGISGAAENLTNFAILVGTGGVTGAIVGVTFAVIDLWKNREKIGESLGSWETEGKKTTTQVTKLEDSLKDLGSLTTSISVDTVSIAAAQQRLDDLKASLDAFNSLSGSATETETRQAAAVREAIAKSGYGGVKGKEQLLKGVIDGNFGLGLTTESEATRNSIEELKKERDQQQQTVRSAASSTSAYGGLRLVGAQNQLNEIERKLKEAEELYAKQQREEGSRIIGAALRGQSDELDQLVKLSQRKGSGLSQEFQDLIGKADIKSLEKSQFNKESEEAAARAAAEYQREQEEFKRAEEEPEKRRQAQKNQRLLEKARKGQKITTKEREEFVQKGTLGSDSREQDLVDAEAAFDEGEAARKADELKRDEEKKKQEEEARRQGKRNRLASGIQTQLGPRLDFALANRKKNDPRLKLFLENEARQQGAGDDSDEVAAQVLEEAGKRMQDEMNKFIGVTRDKNSAMTAYMRELTGKVQQAKQQELQTLSNLNQLRNQSRQFRPSLLPLY